MSEFHGRGGFASPAVDSKCVKRRRVAVELIATVALAVSLIIAVTAVSIGAARAEVLGAVAHNKDASLAIGAVVALVMAGVGGMGGLTGNK